jgi:hypothetical protein
MCPEVIPAGEEELSFLTSCKRNTLPDQTPPVPHLSGAGPSAYLQINRTKINVSNINVLQINGSLHQQKLVEV